MNNNFFNKNTAALTGMLLTFIICFVFFHNKTDLFRFPFQADVWGNAADWTMVAVTGFTAYYLVRSFEAQKVNNAIQAETLREQQKITQIEQFIHRERVKPKFDFKVSPKGKDIKGDKAIFSYAFHFFVQNATARKTSIEIFLYDHQQKENKSAGSGSGGPDKHPGDNISFMERGYEQKKLSVPLGGADFVFRFEFFLEYEDILGNRYKQSIMFYHDSNNKQNLQIRGQQLIES